MAAAAPVGTTFEEKKAKTIACLRREYDSFFNPMEMEFYNDAVSFDDPLISLSGPEAYKKNVEMLAGSNPFGKLLFSECGLTMHNLTQGATPEQIQTRWTLQFRFKLLPWAPLAQFTGVSQYTLDRWGCPRALVTFTAGRPKDVGSPHKG